ncbi:MAG: hypothetical protein KJ645_02575 [Planctomycetes bacterium]|nr:hypothetical protein [Planctomycetota bacterium]
MLESFDPEIHELLEHCDGGDDPLSDFRPERNYLSVAVLETLGSPFADLHFDGFPGQRFSSGNACLEKLVVLGNERLKALFHAEEATLRPSNHAQALAAALEGLLKPGDTVLAPVPGAGGPLVMGHPSTLWADRFRFVRYGPDQRSQAFDYDALKRLAEACNPSLIVVAVYPYPRHQDLIFWKNLSGRLGAFLLVDLGPVAGLVPGGVLPSPTSIADLVTGATNGLMRGPHGGFVLYKKAIKDRIERALFPWLQSGETANQTAAKAVALKEAASRDYRNYVERCRSNVEILCRVFSSNGIDLWGGGADYTYAVLNLRPLGLSGLQGEQRLLEKGIAVQRVPIVFEKGCAHQGDGLVLGTQALSLKTLQNDRMQDLAMKMIRCLQS